VAVALTAGEPSEGGPREAGAVAITKDRSEIIDAIHQAAAA
jgi:hypothetical protein